MHHPPRFRRFALILSILMSLGAMAAPRLTAATPAGEADVVRIPIECEEMKGVDGSYDGESPLSASRPAAPGSKDAPATINKGRWTVGHWGRDLYQNMIFGGVWSSRFANAVTDATDTPAEAFSDVEVPEARRYKLWAKYECPPFFNYPFAVRVEKLDDKGKPAGKLFEQVFGLRNAVKHYSFMSKTMKGDLYWNWGMDHDAAEGYELDLPKGKVRVTLAKAANPDAKANPGPTAGRSVDCLLITSKLTETSAPLMDVFPLMDEFQRENHLYFRYRNTGSAPIVIEHNHWSHRRNYYYYMGNTEGVRFFNADGTVINDDKGAPLKTSGGNWLKPIAPGEFSPWIDLGPTITTENSCPFHATAFPIDAKGVKMKEPPAQPLPFAMDIAFEPSEKTIVKSFVTGKGEPQLAVLIQPDLKTKEGREWTLKTVDVYRRMTEQLNDIPRVGPVPSKIKLYGYIGRPYWGAALAGGDNSSTDGFAEAMDYNIALGHNTTDAPVGNTPGYDRIVAYYKAKKTPFIEVSGKFHHSQSLDVVRGIYTKRPEGLDPKLPIPADAPVDEKARSRFFYISFGDEIGLPHIDLKNEKLLADFRAFLQKRGVKPEEVGFKTLDEVKPLATFSGDVAVQIGVIPKPTSDADKPAIPEGAAAKPLKLLYWLTHVFNIESGVADFAEKTRQMTQAVGPHFKTTANLGGMHPFYWMHQGAFIDSFKGKAMTLAWSEDYDYCQPEISRLVIDFQAAYLRAGSKYHDTPMMFYNMPHYPGNTGTHLLQNAVSLWGQNVKDLDFFCTAPDIFATENYIAARGGVAATGRAMRQISGMAGNIEDALLPARTRKARVAMLLSEASDVWELEGLSQGHVTPAADGKPASAATNVSQEERKAIWNCLRRAGYLVDLITENDLADGYLKDYSVLYVCGRNVERRSAPVIKTWVENGGTLYLTAGAGRRDEADQPLAELDALVGRGEPVAEGAVFYRGPLRAKLEMLFLDPLGRAKISANSALGTPAAEFDAFASREIVRTASHPTQALGEYSDGKFAATCAKVGKGTGIYIGALPGIAWAKPAMRFQPMGKGGPETNAAHFEPTDFNEQAGAAVLLPVTAAKLAPDYTPSLRGVVCNILDSKEHTLVTAVNLTRQTDGKRKDVTITLTTPTPVKSATTALKAKVGVETVDGKTVLRLKELDEADVIVLSR